MEQNDPQEVPVVAERTIDATYWNTSTELRRSDSGRAMRQIPDHRREDRSAGVGAMTRVDRAVDPLRLRLLVELERLGSITRAAEACEVRQSTASTQLRTLELAVGHPLYERTARGTTLTDTGQLLSRHAATILGRIEALDQDLAALEGARTGTLRVAACEAFGNYVVPSVLAEFAAARPDVAIHVSVAPSGQVVRAVAEGAVQLGIAGQARRIERVVAQPIWHDELVWIARAGNSNVPAVISSTAVGELALVVPSADSSTRALTERILGQAECRPARIVEFDSVEGVKRAVRSGVGVAVVSRLVVADELAAGQLRELPFAGSAPTFRTIALVRPEFKRATPLERVFEDVLRDHCRHMGPGVPPRAA